MPIARYQGWVGSAWRYSVVPVEGGKFRGTTRRKPVPVADGIIDFASDGGRPAELFGEFCEKNLCSESWDFVVIAVHYETVRQSENCIIKYIVATLKMIVILRGQRIRASERIARLVLWQSGLVYCHAVGKRCTYQKAYVRAFLG